MSKGRNFMSGIGEILNKVRINGITGLCALVLNQGIVSDHINTIPIESFESREKMIRYYGVVVEKNGFLPDSSWTLRNYVTDGCGYFLEKEIKSTRIRGYWIGLITNDQNNNFYFQQVMVDSAKYLETKVGEIFDGFAHDPNVVVTKETKILTEKGFRCPKKETM